MFLTTLISQARYTNYKCIPEVHGSTILWLDYIVIILWKKQCLEKDHEHLLSIDWEISENHAILFQCDVNVGSL